MKQITVKIKNVYGKDLYYPVCQEAKRFARMGPSSAQIFLYSIGENIKHEL